MTKQQDPYSSRDVLEPLYRKLAALQARVDALENKSIPTVPSYDSANFPQDSIEGQIAVGANDNLLHWFVNGLWREATAGASWPWAFSAINGFYNIPDSTPTDFALDDGNLTTNTDDSTVFETESLGGYAGLKINSPGIIAFFWTVNLNDVVGNRVTNPENYIAEAQDACGSTGTFVISSQWFSNFARGYTNVLDGTTGQWDVGWLSIWATDGTTAGNPFIISGYQETGETLRAYVQLWAIQFSSSTHGWT